LERGPHRCVERAYPGEAGGGEQARRAGGQRRARDGRDFAGRHREAAERAAEENALLEARSEALLQQATPVTPIWEGILLLPLIGVLDSSRTQEIMTKTLSMISETRTKVFMLDISGVRTVDTAVANQLVKITQATRLMGCEAIVSGISPEIAFTMVELGVGIGQIRTTATLRDAFEIALTLVGDAARLRPDATRPRPDAPTGA
jgi:methyl-accepting chemotaxis protein